LTRTSMLFTKDSNVLKATVIAYASGTLGVSILSNCSRLDQNKA
jgi:hypothetical protein